ncbi:DUF3710 domain-containing protein [Nocardioides lijunqiniae]|uniref:DUF3710 domain-containing protein n=1 Tax=Nocardioides lijunqiniae TaxID=2760832 RepID=UPI001878AB05
MKFRRKSDADAVPETDVESDSSEADSGPTGPYDVADLVEGVDRVDLGSLVIEPEAGRELRLQVDEQSGDVQAVVLAGADGAVELRAFAAPRNGDLWADVRPQIAADMARRGGTATEREGAFGPELLCELTVTRADGSTGSQPSRIVGVNGPRWLLRATFLGRPAVEPAGAAAWEDTLRRVAVRRGGHALPVGEPLPLILPENARRADAPSE